MITINYTYKTIKMAETLFQGITFDLYNNIPLKLFQKYHFLKFYKTGNLSPSQFIPRNWSFARTKRPRRNLLQHLNKVYFFLILWHRPSHYTRSFFTLICIQYERPLLCTNTNNFLSCSFIREMETILSPLLWTILSLCEVVKAEFCTNIHARNNYKLAVLSPALGFSG